MTERSLCPASPALGARAPAKRALRVDSVSPAENDMPSELAGAAFLI